MDTEAMEEFGRLLVVHVRDEAIRHCDRRLSGNVRGPITERWRNAVATLRSDELSRFLAVDIVDTVIGQLLWAIDQELLALSYTSSNGTVIDLTRVATEFGELSGSYGGSWREEYSTERVTIDPVQ